MTIICEEIYKVNKVPFAPFKYKNVVVAASDLNIDKNHLTNRLSERGKNYTINDVTIIIKRFIDHYVTDKKLKSFHQTLKSFNIKSNSYKDIIVNVIVEPNKLYDMFDINSSDIFKTSKHICFVFTILKSNMITKITDRTVITEEIGNDTLTIEVE